MYPEYMKPSLDKVTQTRAMRFELEKSGKPVYPPMSAKEREEVLNKFHPDYKPESRRKISIGLNKGELLTTEVVDILESHSRIKPELFNLEHPDYETDILIIGGGGAGCAAAIIAMQNGAKSIISTKLRMGDANSMMSQGGMQAAVTPQDSPARHFLDAMGGGHFDNKPDLVRALTEDGPDVVKWLEELGVVWDKDNEGEMLVLHGGDTSRKRMHSCRDYTGAVIMRTLMDEVRNHPDKITTLEFMPTVELIMDDKGRCAGGILYNMETEEYFTVKAKATIIATGGYGRLHIRGFDTTNHYGATGDGLVVAYRAGAKLLYMDSVQYHPTGAAFPEQIAGFLITEKIRGAGGQPLNKHGQLFVFPREPRDVESSAFIRECLERNNGIETPSGRLGVWLDSPLIDMLRGEGYIKKNFPAMLRQFIRYGIDITKEPMLVYPSLHYQNGGVEINDHCETNIPGLFVAGEASGGVHGRNRLMGNSVLNTALEKKKEYGDLMLIYGARTSNDLVFKQELEELRKRMAVHLSIDVAEPGWKEFVGFVPQNVTDKKPSPKNAISVTCGPPIMIKFVIKALKELGFEDAQIYTTVENKMKCGIGKCGRCNIGLHYVCKDGPVYSWAELKNLPQEY